MRSGCCSITVCSARSLLSIFSVVCCTSSCGGWAAKTAALNSKPQLSNHILSEFSLIRSSGIQQLRHMHIVVVDGPQIIGVGEDVALEGRDHLVRGLRPRLEIGEAR